MTGAPKIGKSAFVDRLAQYAAARSAFDLIMYIPFDGITAFLRDVRNNDQKITLDVLIEYIFWVGQGGFVPAIDLSWNRAQAVNRTALLLSLLRGKLPGQERLRDRQWYMLFVLDSCNHILEVDVLAELVNILMHGSGRPGSINVVMTARTSIKLEVNGAVIDGALEIPLEGIPPSTSYVSLM